jgi:hypothetical protein
LLTTLGPLVLCCAHVIEQLYRLSVTDLSEVARNSVLQSGFKHDDKVQWIGDNYWKSGIEGNSTRARTQPSISSLSSCRFHMTQRLLNDPSIVWLWCFSRTAPSKTNLPHLRIAFRSELLQSEKDFITHMSQKEITNATQVRFPPRLCIRARADGDDDGDVMGAAGAVDQGGGRRGQEQHPAHVGPVPQGDPQQRRHSQPAPPLCPQDPDARASPLRSHGPLLLNTSGSSLS